jgi:murein DD-endopeptidase MepM/ murein hydrolase activator NlpD
VQGSDGTLNVADPAVGQGDGRFGAPRAGGRSHRGIDIPAPVGTPVRVVQDGQVVFSDRGSDMEGYKVKVRHADGSVSVYMHLDGSRMPSVGQRVSAGTVIGAVGRTGNTPAGAQPHLHLQVYGPDGELHVPNIQKVSPLELPDFPGH